MTSIRPFRFSIVAEVAKSRKEWLDKAYRAEDLGYTTLLMPDHLGFDVDPIVGLMAVADATSLRIGSHVFCNDFRYPIVLARQAANLDLFSEGRFQLGLGCGYLAEEYHQAGISLDPVGVRISRFEEALQIIKAYFREEQVTFSGKHYQIQGLKTAIKTMQKPHLPIYVGGGGKRILSIAAREADIVGLVARNNSKGLDWTSALPDANREKRQWVREAAGERFSQLEFSSTIFIAAATDHPQPAAQKIGSRLGLTAEQALDCLHILIGTTDQMVEELQKRRELFGISNIEVTEPHMETLAPVIARLAGK
ncbi:TIGR03621 family F420-dependent LLM class oxidoreductase [Ktedonobacter racemifer]|uniref:Putative F420-dependent oxidoreductase n=1 Tax=Ktedonobacter racemifer DSM 44963 TaxID=485913 RepID=D6U207_KTERA|nr:TIGR03621 family F420-dependent LLM class oxidoreductase [Ktedonobacter racemifer]EFH80891.1 putative F420-dependent oxidoreductase [Ktedonobacter racemifer DSM 44963]